MGRRRVTPVPHREFFRGGGAEETIALACTCPRAQDHWYAEPKSSPVRRKAPDESPAASPGARDDAGGTDDRQSP